MPTPEEIAAKLARRNNKIRTEKSMTAKKKKAKSGKGSAKGRKRADPGNTMKRRTKSALRSRVAKVGGVKNLTAADRQLAQREDLDLDLLF